MRAAGVWAAPILLPTPRCWLPGQGSNLGSLLQRQASYQLDDPATGGRWGGVQVGGAMALRPPGVEPARQLLRLIVHHARVYARPVGGRLPTLAAPTGAAPATSRLTAGRSAAELRNRMASPKRAAGCRSRSGWLATTAGLAPAASAFARRRSVCLSYVVSWLRWKGSNLHASA